MLTFGLAAVTAVSLLAAIPAAGIGRMGDLQIVTRGDGQPLPIYPKGGRNWVVGLPGQEYSIRYCNTTPGRVLAVMSVDGVNVVSGDTAAPSQSGYVLSAYECADIHGWRKNMHRTAAFYFTELPDAYATRTGRPENVGVVGVAVFREKPAPVLWKENAGRISGESRRDAPLAKSQAGAADSVEQDARSRLESAAPREEAAAPASAPVPAPMSKLGTGHGRSEDSPTRMVRFERESATPNETIAIHYDRRENLVAMGILPQPYVARAPNPFPGWTHFVPDPPNR